MQTHEEMNALRVDAQPHIDALKVIFRKTNGTRVYREVLKDLLMGVDLTLKSWTITEVQGVVDEIHEERQQ